MKLKNSTKNEKKAKNKLVENLKNLCATCFPYVFNQY
jgi:hypothetical protein